MTQTLVAPSILSADFGHLHAEIASISSADWIHVDVMDGKFVPNITIGPLIVEAARRASAALDRPMPLDVHLMIVEPDRYLADFRKAGAHVMVAGSAVFGAKDRAAAISAIRSA